MTRYELARKQVRARQNGNTGLFWFLLAVGGLYMAGGAVGTHFQTLRHSIKSGIETLMNRGVFQNASKQLAKEDVQKVTEDVSEISISKDRERD